jgi:hypothetical protein
MKNLSALYLLMNEKCYSHDNHEIIDGGRRVLLVRLRFFYMLRHHAVRFVLSDTTLAETGGTELAIEFLTVSNFVSTFAAFDGPVDELKHAMPRTDV